MDIKEGAVAVASVPSGDGGGGSITRANTAKINMAANPATMAEPKSLTISNLRSIVPPTNATTTTTATLTKASTGVTKPQTFQVFHVTVNGVPKTLLLPVGGNLNVKPRLTTPDTKLMTAVPPRLPIIQNMTPVISPNAIRVPPIVNASSNSNRFPVVFSQPSSGPIMVSNTGAASTPCVVQLPQNSVTLPNVDQRIIIPTSVVGGPQVQNSSILQTSILQPTKQITSALGATNPPLRNIIKPQLTSPIIKVVSPQPPTYRTLGPNGGSLQPQQGFVSVVPPTTPIITVSVKSEPVETPPINESINSEEDDSSNDLGLKIDSVFSLTGDAASIAPLAPPLPDTENEDPLEERSIMTETSFTTETASEDSMNPGEANDSECSQTEGNDECAESGEEYQPESDCESEGESVEVDEDGIMEAQELVRHLQVKLDIKAQLTQSDDSDDNNTTKDVSDVLGLDMHTGKDKVIEDITDCMQGLPLGLEVRFREVTETGETIEKREALLDNKLKEILPDMIMPGALTSHKDSVVMKQTARKSCTGRAKQFKQTARKSCTQIFHNKTITKCSEEKECKDIDDGSDEHASKMPSELSPSSLSSSSKLQSDSEECDSINNDLDGKDVNHNSSSVCDGLSNIKTGTEIVNPKPEEGKNVDSFPVSNEPIELMKCSSKSDTSRPKCEMNETDPSKQELQLLGKIDSNSQSPLHQHNGEVEKPLPEQQPIENDPEGKPCVLERQVKSASPLAGLLNRQKEEETPVSGEIKDSANSVIDSLHLTDSDEGKPSHIHETRTADSPVSQNGHYCGASAVNSMENDKRSETLDTFESSQCSEGSSVDEKMRRVSLSPSTCDSKSDSCTPDEGKTNSLDGTPTITSHSDLSDRPEGNDSGLKKGGPVYLVKADNLLSVVGGKTSSLHEDFPADSSESKNQDDSSEEEEEVFQMSGQFFINVTPSVITNIPFNPLKMTPVQFKVLSAITFAPKRAAASVPQSLTVSPSVPPQPTTARVSVLSPNLLRLGQAVPRQVPPAINIQAIERYPIVNKPIVNGFTVGQSMANQPFVGQPIFSHQLGNHFVANQPIGSPKLLSQQLETPSISCQPLESQNTDNQTLDLKITSVVSLQEMPSNDNEVSTQASPQSLSPQSQNVQLNSQTLNPQLLNQALNPQLLTAQPLNSQLLSPQPPNPQYISPPALSIPSSLPNLKCPQTLIPSLTITSEEEPVDNRCLAPLTVKDILSGRRRRKQPRTVRSLLDAKRNELGSLTSLTSESMRHNNEESNDLGPSCLLKRRKLGVREESGIPRCIPRRRGRPKGSKNKKPRPHASELRRIANIQSTWRNKVNKRQTLNSMSSLNVDDLFEGETASSMPNEDIDMKISMETEPGSEMQSPVESHDEQCADRVDGKGISDCQIPEPSNPNLDLVKSSPESQNTEKTDVESIIKRRRGRPRKRTNSAGICSDVEAGFKEPTALDRRVKLEKVCDSEPIQTSGDHRDDPCPTDRQGPLGSEQGECSPRNNDCNRSKGDRLTNSPVENLSHKNELGVLNPISLGCEFKRPRGRPKKNQLRKNVKIETSDSSKSVERNGGKGVLKPVSHGCEIRRPRGRPRKNQHRANFVDNDCKFKRPRGRPKKLKTLIIRKQIVREESKEGDGVTSWTEYSITTSGRTKGDTNGKKSICDSVDKGFDGTPLNDENKSKCVGPAAEPTDVKGPECHVIPPSGAGGKRPRGRPRKHQEVTESSRTVPSLPRHSKTTQAASDQRSLQKHTEISESDSKPTKTKIEVSLDTSFTEKHGLTVINVDLSEKEEESTVEPEVTQTIGLGDDDKVEESCNRPRESDESESVCDENVITCASSELTAGKSEQLSESVSAQLELTCNNSEGVVDSGHVVSRSGDPGEKSSSDSSVGRINRLKEMLKRQEEALAAVRKAREESRKVLETVDL